MHPSSARAVAAGVSLTGVSFRLYPGGRSLVLLYICNTRNVVCMCRWRRLLPTTTRVEHLLSLSEMGPVALLQQKGAVFCKEEDGTDVATGQLDGKSGALFVGELLPGVSASTDQDGILHFQSSRGSAGYFGRPTATAAYFTEHGFASPLVGRLERNRREVWLTGSSQLLQALGKRPLAERLQQWQWSLPRMERLPEGYVHKVPITGKEWGNYHAKKRNWKRIF